MGLLKNKPVFFFGFSKIIGAFRHDLFQVLGVGINAVAHFIEGPGQAPDFIFGLDRDIGFRTFAADFQCPLKEPFNGAIHKEKDVTDNNGGNEEKQGQVEQNRVNDIAADLLIDADQGGAYFEEAQLALLGRMGVAGGGGTTGFIGNRGDDAEYMLLTGAFFKPGPLGKR